MKRYHSYNSDNIQTSNTSSKSHKKKKYDSSKIYHKLLSIVFENKLNRVFILALILTLSALAYHFNTMDVLKVASLQGPKESDDIYVPFARMRKLSRFKRPTMRTIEKFLIRSKSSRVKSTSKVPAERSSNHLPSTVSPFRDKTGSSSRLPATVSPSGDKTPWCPNPTSDTECRMFSCFNYSRCPLTGSFPIYLYDDADVVYNGLDGITAPIRNMLSVNNYITADPAEACIFIIVAELSYEQDRRIEDTLSKSSYTLINEATLNTLPHWGLNGENHVLLNMGFNTFAENTGSAMIAQSTFTHEHFRPGFDVVLSATQGSVPVLDSERVTSTSPPMEPARRKILLSFQEGDRKKLAKILQNLEYARVHNFSLDMDCRDVKKRVKGYNWTLCYKSRKKMISTFALIPAPTNDTYFSTNSLQMRLYWALKKGEVPIILGGDRIRLPFEEVLDWRRAAICLPTSRFTDLKELLIGMADEDILAFRKNGYLLWERYLSTMQASVDTLLAVIRARVNIAPQAKFSRGNETRKYQSTTYEPKRNFALGLLNAYEQWNL